MEFSEIDSHDGQPIFSPCFTYFAIFKDGTVIIKNGKSSKCETIFQVSLRVKGKSQNQPICKNVRFSPDSRYFTVKIDKGIKIYTLKGQLKAEIYDPDYEIDDFFWSEKLNKYQIIVSYKKLNRYEIFDLTTKEVVIIENVKDFTSKNYAFTKSTIQGEYIAVLEKKTIQWKTEKPSDFIGLYSTETLSCRGFFKLNSKKADKIEFSKHGELILIGENNFLEVNILNFQTRETKNLLGENDFMGVSAHKISQTGGLLAIGTYFDRIFLFDTKTWMEIGEIKIEDKLILSDYLTLQKEENDQFVVLKKGKYLLEQRKQKQQKKFHTVFNCINRLEFSPEDKFLAVGHSGLPCHLFIYKLSGMCLLTVIQTQNHITDFKWIESSGIHNLCIAAGKNGVLVWRSNSFEGNLYQIMLPKGELKVSSIEMGREGRMLLVSKEQKKYVYAYCDSSVPDWPESAPQGIQ